VPVQPGNLTVYGMKNGSFLTCRLDLRLTKENKEIST
jgi:hypothetical protein